MATTEELIEEIKVLAVEPDNYNAGWDVIAEAYDDQMLWDVLVNARTLDAAKRRVAPIIEGHLEKVEMARQEREAGEDLREMPTVVPGRTTAARKAKAAKAELATV